MVHVIAEIEVRDGTREAFLKEFRRIVPIVRDEDGCMEYAPTIDAEVAIAPAVRPDVVTVIEKWTSEAALMAHHSAPHMLEYRKRAGHMVANVTIRAYHSA